VVNAKWRNLIIAGGKRGEMAALYGGSAKLASINIDAYSEKRGNMAWHQQRSAS